MRTRRLLIAVGLACIAAACQAGMAAAADPTPAKLLTTTEQDCVETNVPRAVKTSALDPLVPDRYTLSAVSPTASRLTVTTYTCQNVSMDGGLPLNSDVSPIVVTIATAVVTQRDGQPLPNGEQQYIVWYGTDNLTQFTNLRQVGLPASYVPRSSATVDDDRRGADWAIRGAGLDYTLTATEPVRSADAPSSEPTVYWHDGPQGALRVAYDNQVERGTALVTADFTANELLTGSIAQPQLLTPTRVRFGFTTGSWTSTVEAID